MQRLSLRLCDASAAPLPFYVSYSTSHNRILPHPFILLEASGGQGRTRRQHTATHTDGHSLELVVNITHTEQYVWPISAPGGTLIPSESNCGILFLAQGSKSPLHPFMCHR